MNNILAIENLRQISLRKEQLPDNIKELKNFIIIGEGVLKAHRSQLNTIKKIGVAQNYYNAKLYDGQSVAEIVLEAQGKLGRVLEKTVKPRGNTSLGYQGRTKSLPPTISKKESHIAQSISKNPEVVREVIERAKDKKEIPTTREVLEEIQIRIKEAKKEKIINYYKQRAGEYSENGSIQILQGDFREMTKQFPDNHFDHIVTDPPYGEEYLPLYSDLSKMAVRVLKPSGFCIAYSGKLYLPEVLTRLEEYLNYYWMIAIHGETPNARVFARKIWQSWKPVLIFSKPPRELISNFTTDTIESLGPEKSLHSWQQPEGPLNELLEKFTHPGDLILDPMAGSGTTLVSCFKNQRKCVGIEIEKENIEIIKGRINVLAT